MSLSRDDVLRLLAEVGEELTAKGIEGRMFVVGGAAMALAFRRDRLTDDIDAVFEPKAAIYEAARSVAARNRLHDGWLNDAVKGMLLGMDSDATTMPINRGLAIQVASARYLFVMKALSARADRDAADLLALYVACGFRSVEEALAHVTSTAPPHLLTPKAEFFVRELLQHPQ
ncbi:hypothetical protein BH23ACT9_BH23ACT9_24680 [soil metagenome]